MRKVYLNPREQLRFTDIVVASTSMPDYEMDRIMLIDDRYKFEYDDMGELNWIKEAYIIAEGSHCSCYDFDETVWEFIAYTREELIRLCKARISDFEGKWVNHRLCYFWKMVLEYIGG